MLRILAQTLGLVVATWVVACGGDGSTPAGCTTDLECVVASGDACQVAVCDPVARTCGTASAPAGTACEAAQGQPGTCQAGACVPNDACVAKGSTDATCDGVDDDCDGATDDDFVGAATACGVGACAAEGALTCSGGQVVDTCRSGGPAAGDATCDGVDDDCDGATDDDFAGAATACGVGACAAEGALTCSAGQVQDTCATGTPGAADPTCDGVDDDCDGATDEEYAGAATSCGAGACAAAGALTCANGQAHDTCQPGAPAADDATCDAIDDDCDGATDEAYVASVVACGVGACLAEGTTACVDGHESDSCSPAGPGGSDAVCNGLDDDCDGMTDEDVVPTPTTCGVGACAAAGVLACVGGVPVDDCQAGAPAASDTTCDGADDDCNGQVDEDFVPGAVSCGVGACAAAGATACVDGVLVDVCQPGAPAASDATCDGVDQDCDGQSDDDYVVTATACGTGGCAATGQLMCVDAHEVDTCVAGTPGASDASCNGVDDDCDGATDEAYVVAPTSCGRGACAAVGYRTCVGGQAVDSCVPGVPGPSDATCDGVDDDCDTATDEDFAATPTTCGAGACAATGALACVSGNVLDTCASGAPAAADATCDGVDDDCDGATDEDYAPTPTICGVGACQAAGTTACVAGVVSDSCSSGGGGGTDTVCNGVDDDCNGLTDDGYVIVPTTCGVGACARTGATACVAGVVHDSCAPGAPGASDTTCDGVDDDCNGLVDDGYAGHGTTCGVGACARAGATHCVGGQVSDTCVAGAPAASDATCDGVDDDCNGLADDGYAGAGTTCGVGACARAGVTHCVGGVVTDTCAAGTPAASDATCNGIDDNCNGAIDEGYVATATTCGSGVCTSTGLATCSGGVVSDSCVPAPPGPGGTCAAVFIRPEAPSGKLLLSSWADPDSSASDYYAYDDFTVPADTVVTEVRWRGGYVYSALYGHVTDFSLTFYDSTAGNTQPHVVPPNLQEIYLAQYRVGGNAGETPAGTVGTTTMYEYRYVLPTPFAVTAGTRYWLRIEASQSILPDWGISEGTGGDGSYYRYSYAYVMFQWAPGDTAFTLL